MDIHDIKHLAVERIFLVPDASEGQLGYVWCDDPAPGLDMDASEAVEYVRKDVHEARIEQLEEREAALAAQFVAMQDAATDLIHASSEEEAGDAMERIAECSEKQARELLARRDLMQQAEGALSFVEWIAKECESNSEVGEIFGMTISGFTGDSRAAPNMRAARMIFADAKKLAEWRLEQAQASQ